MSVTNIVNKIIGWSGYEEEYDDAEGYEEVEENVANNYEAYPEESPAFNPNSSHQAPAYTERKNPSVKQKKPMNKKVVEMPGIAQGNTEVMVVEPQSFDEMPKVIDALRERKSVVLNLEKMSPQEAQRSVDFVAGGTYAMDGHNERVGDSIFLFTPSCVTVSSLSGLISGADDFSSARNRQPHSPASNPVASWNNPTAMAQ